MQWEIGFVLKTGDFIQFCQRSFTNYQRNLRADRLLSIISSDSEDPWNVLVEACCMMNHSYFAGLLENYRKRMKMDPSVLSIRKALYDSYKNESFKLRERQRQEMAKQRRDQMETDRIFQNRLKEIKEKEKEIGKRYAHLRKLPTENEVLRYTEPHKEKENSTRQKLLILPPLNGLEINSENGKGLYLSENQLIRDARRVNKPRHSAETKLCHQYSNKCRVFPQKQKSNGPLSPQTNSRYTENLPNYYKSPKGLQSFEKSFSSTQVANKKTNICTLTLEEQSSYTGNKGDFHIYSPDYDILVIEHEEDRSSHAEF